MKNPAAPQTPKVPVTSHAPGSGVQRLSRVRRLPGVLAFTVGGLLLLSAAIPAGVRFDRAMARPADPTELALFPTGDWVRPAVCGFSALAADIVWLRALQYYGQHRGTDRHYPYLETLFRTLTDLDPHFINAYIFGALTLAEDEHREEAALELLRRGIARNPESWWLVFEYGFMFYVHGHDPVRASYWLTRAAHMEGAPEWTARLAAHASSQAGQATTAIALWREVYRNTENDEIRRIAVEKLAELGVSVEPNERVVG
ncbi:MAG: hypothetical protein KC729_03395 [Candidatus Eisenbacteria bacterium]|uniref:Tetratricopeptide repeat protein n=1 Tax=Eiseniibacteriota bacterium TaxID=2212470 RepID=A0A956RMR2_UNCEI|nr:hypothetical protein [Candidatus Eisenbacteria bacterium]